MLIVTLSLLALAVAAAAVIAGVIESGRISPVKAAATPASPAPEAEAETEATLSVVRPTAVPVPQSTPAPSPTTDTQQAVPPPPAVAPEVIQTVQARPPAQQPPAQAPKVCPAGTVTSGLTDVMVQNERYSTSAQYSTVVDIIGHGNIHNGTTAAVKVSLYIPTVKGLDVNGKQTLIHFSGDFDYVPPPGTPRPYEIPVGPGENAAYSFSATGVAAADVRETIAWYADPASNVGDYADFDIYLSCPDVPVSPPAGGPSILNTYVPWGP